MKRAAAPARSLRRQQGIATLVVVMVLFFIVSLVAAYTSRNLIFEQRTSANQYRSTQALEVAEAGLEWGLAMLNGGRIDADCLPSANGADKSFRERYLAFDANGYIAGKLGVSGGYLYPTCVLDGTAWTCRCPADSPPASAPAAPTTPGAHPAFRLYFHLVGPASATQSAQPGMVQIYVNACTQLDDECLKFNPAATGGPSVATGVTNESLANVFVVAALTGTAASPPVATLTALGTVTLPGTLLQVYNGDAAAGGIAIHAGGSVTIGGTAGSAPGAPGGSDAIVDSDSAISSTTLDADPAPPFSRPSMFANVFNMRGDVFREQPATLFIDCSLSCTAATVRTQIALNPGRPVWINGNFAVDSAGDFGTPTEPVLMVVTGDLDFGSFGSIISGIVYVKGANWSGLSARLNGAIVAEGNVSGSASTTPTLVYAQAIIDRVRHTVGSFVRVPGSWKDFK